MLVYMTNTGSTAKSNVKENLKDERSDYMCQVYKIRHCLY